MIIYHTVNLLGVMRTWCVAHSGDKKKIKIAFYYLTVYVGHWLNFIIELLVVLMLGKVHFLVISYFCLSLFLFSLSWLLVGVRCRWLYCFLLRIVQSRWSTQWMKLSPVTMYRVYSNYKKSGYVNYVRSMKRMRHGLNKNTLK